MLLLAAALQLQASRAATAVDAVGWHVVGSERTIDRLYALRADFEQNGPLRWPIAVDGPGTAFTTTLLNRNVSRTGQLYVTSYADGMRQRCHACRASWNCASCRRSWREGWFVFPLIPTSCLRGEHSSKHGSRSRRSTRLSPPSSPSSEIRQRWRDELREAERDFEKAVRTAGLASEAAVRLARVRLLKGEQERARDLLDRVLAGDLPTQIRYLALLFRGAAAEQSGDMQAAARDYEAAVDTFPGAQTPMLALGQIADNTIGRQPPTMGRAARSVQIRARSIRGMDISRGRRGRSANA